MKTLLISLILLFAFLNGLSQEQPCTTTFNDRSRYIKFGWANDALKLRGITDRYFTNGNSLEYFYLPKNPAKFERIFLRMPCTSTRNNNFAVGFHMQMFTPTDISLVAIDSGNRPYAGWAYVSLKCISNEFSNSDRITTEYSIGIIGEHSYQKEVQTWFHKIIGSQKPMGWGNQIHDDIALNVKVDYEKGLLRPNKNIEMIGLVEANFGTVTNFMGLGSTIRLGSFNDYFINELGLRADSTKFVRYEKETKDFTSRKVFRQNLLRKLQFYFFIRNSLRVVIDNSLLQGGLFNYDESPYVLSSDEIKRFYFNAEFGVNITYKGVGIIYSQHFRTAEFKNAFDTNWGSATAVFRIKGK